MERNFHTTLSALRKERNINQRKAAADLNISQALLSHYENGIREPGLGFVCKACEYYGVSADYILCRSENRTAANTLSDNAEKLLNEMQQLLDRARHELNNHSTEEDLT